MDDNFVEESLPENYGKPIDQATFALLLAEMEKSLRKLRTLAHINRNLLGVIEAINNSGVDRATLYAENARYIDTILDTSESVSDYRWTLMEWRENLRKVNPLIPPRGHTNGS